MAVADHPPQAGFDVHEGCRQPPLALAGVLPVVDLRAAFLDESIDGFKAVRRLERTAQRPVHAETMQCERLLDSFLQAPSCGLVPLLQFIVQLIEGREGLFIFRPVVGRLQPLAQRRLLALGQIAHDIFTFVPLAPLYQDPLSERLLYGRFQTLAAIDDHQ